MVTHGPLPDPEVLGSLLPRSGVVTGGQLQSREAGREAVSSGFRQLDALLPAGGVRRGSLIEWLAGDEAAASGMGAVTLACAVACRLAAVDARAGTIVVVDRSGWFHPPAVLPWLAGDLGARHTLRRLLVARPSSDDDEVWSIDQALRCPGVAAVLAVPRSRMVSHGFHGLHGLRGLHGRHGMPATNRPSGPHGLRQWTTAMRRWQLAARSSGAVGFFVRSESVRREPSWAETRLSVSALPGGDAWTRRLRLSLIGGAWSAADPDTERSVELTLDVARGCAGTAADPPARRRSMEIVPDGATCRAS
jgi:protein ImuA